MGSPVLKTVLIRWQDWPLGTKSAAAVLLPMALLMFALFFSYTIQQQITAAEADVRRAQAIQTDIQTLHSQIAEAATENEVDSLLVASVVEVESTFDPKAGSHKGAVGLMQLLPSTAGMSRARLMEPATNLAAGSAYLAEMIERFDGDLGLALAAYNAGPTNVRRYEGVPPFPETEQYVEKVLSRYVEYHRQLWRVSHGIDLGTIAS